MAPINIGYTFLSVFCFLRASLNLLEVGSGEGLARRPNPPALTEGEGRTDERGGACKLPYFPSFHFPLLIGTICILSGGQRLTTSDFPSNRMSVGSPIPQLSECRGSPSILGFDNGLRTTDRGVGWVSTPPPRVSYGPARPSGGCIYNLAWLWLVSQHLQRP